MDIDELCRKAAEPLRGHLHYDVGIIASRISEVIGPALAARDAEIERLKDHPDADCTDAAHPAWWRGHEHTVASMCAEINKILDGDDSGAGVSTEPWESVRRRLLKLNAKSR